jgi:hypothetical protein
LPAFLLLGTTPPHPEQDKKSDGDGNEENGKVLILFPKKETN